MKSFKLPLSIWVYIGGIVVLGVIGQFMNHIKRKSKK